MALINDPNVTAQIRNLANTGTIDSNEIISLLKILSRKYLILTLDKKKTNDKEKYFNININNFKELNNFIKKFKYNIYAAINATYPTLKKKIIIF